MMNLESAIAELRRRNEKVPKPLRLPTPQEVDAMEQELGVKFHPDFRTYLLKASDVVFGTKEPATITDPDSHTHLSSLCEDAWETLDISRKLLPICEDNGDFYCMEPSGRIVFCDHNGTTGESWPDLATWIMEVWIGEDEEDEEEDE